MNLPGYENEVEKIAREYIEILRGEHDYVEPEPPREREQAIEWLNEFLGEHSWLHYSKSKTHYQILQFSNHHTAIEKMGHNGDQSWKNKVGRAAYHAIACDVHAKVNELKTDD